MFSPTKIDCGIVLLFGIIGEETEAVKGGEGEEAGRESHFSSGGTSPTKIDCGIVLLFGIIGEETKAVKGEGGESRISATSSGRSSISLSPKVGLGTGRTGTCGVFVATGWTGTCGVFVSAIFLFLSCCFVRACFFLL